MARPKKAKAMERLRTVRPSDSDGIFYVPLDDNHGWELRLLQELKAAGFVVDANLALSA